MNASSFRALEFETIRGLLLSHAGSARGKARLEGLTPATDPGRVREGLQITLEAASLLAAHGRQPYHDLPEIEEALAGSKVEGMHLEPAQLRDVASFLEGATEIVKRVAALEAAPRLSRRASLVLA